MTFYATSGQAALRCTFPHCAAGNKAMKPLLLGLQMERTHDCLKTLLEADSRPGIVMKGIRYRDHFLSK
jgi:hypothetical protein